MTNPATLAAIVREAVESSPSPASFAAMSERDRERHTLARQRAGLTEAEYLAGFVTSEALASPQDAAEIARSHRRFRPFANSGSSHPT